MKFAELKSIGHNIADSLAGGAGLMIGWHETFIFEEAARSPEGYITVDFLTGETDGATPSPGLADAIKSYSQTLKGLCERHGYRIEQVSTLTARFSGGPLNRRFTVTVRDRNGRQSVDEYAGTPGQRIKVLDDLGRLRPKRSAP